MGCVALTHRNRTVKRALKARLSAPRDAFSNPTLNGEGCVHPHRGYGARLWLRSAARGTGSTPLRSRVGPPRRRRGRRRGRRCRRGGGGGSGRSRGGAAAGAAAAPPPVPGGRLDVGTSGVVLFGTTPRGSATLGRLLWRRALTNT